MTDLTIENIQISSLKPWANNARTHSKKQVRQIADSFEEYGVISPILIDENMTILAGHGRIEAAKLLGMETVPCVQISSLTPAQKRAYVIADNKLALNAGWNAGWDEELLAQELEALSTLDIDLTFS